MLTNQYKLVIGIDQSYKRTGISIIKNGNLKQAKTIDFKGCNCNSDKRKLLSKVINSILLKSCSGANIKPQEVLVICERIRIASHGFLSQDYIKSTGALIATIIDVSHKYGVEVYSVDTRAWKSQVVGTSKPQANKFGIAPEKWPTIKYVKINFTEQDIYVPASQKQKKGVICKNGKRFTVNDDLCDAICIGLFYQKSADPKRYLKLEQF